MTFLQLINEVLIRLRSDQVSIIDQDKYATLIGRFVNEAKRQVEDAWSWDANNISVTFVTTPGVSKYTVTGIGVRARDVVINNFTNKAILRNAPKQWILDQQQLATVTNAQPSWFAWDGNNGVDAALQLYPTPNSAVTIYVNANVPQVDLVAASDVLTVPWEVVVANAYARALVERGEDGGLMSSEAYGLYKSVLADRIALDSSNGVEYECWEAT